MSLTLSGRESWNWFTGSRMGSVTSRTLSFLISSSYTDKSCTPLLLGGQRKGWKYFLVKGPLAEISLSLFILGETIPWPLFLSFKKKSFGSFWAFFDSFCVFLYFSLLSSDFSFTVFSLRRLFYCFCLFLILSISLFPLFPSAHHKSWSFLLGGIVGVSTKFKQNSQLFT